MCGDALDLPDGMIARHRGQSVCRDADCQCVVALLARMEPASRESHLRVQRGLIRQRRERNARVRRHEAAIVEAEAEADRRIVEAVRTETKPSRDFAVVSIPSGRTEVCTVSAERRERYRAHLESVIAEAGQGGGKDAAASDRHHAARKRALDSERFLSERPALQKRCDQACGLCKGGCCTTGKEHAFISTVTIRRVMDADPSLTAEDILQRYLAHVPTESIAEACINQTATGCALPREWRSDVCNAYFCDGLKTLQSEWDEAVGPDQVLMIRRANTTVNRFVSLTANPVVEVAWADDRGTRTVTVPPESVRRPRTGA